MAGLQLLTAFLLVVVSTVQGANHQGNCPEIQLPNNSNGTCLLNDQCSQVTCTSPKDDENPFGRMVLTVRVTKCQNKLKAAVSIDSNDHVWARLLGDGDKAELPSPPGMSGPKPYLKVNLKENGDKVHFKLLMLMEPANFSVTLLEGELRALECTIGEEENHDESCPGIQLPKESNGTCVLSEKCSKVTCTSPEDETKPFGKAVLTVKVEECQGKLKAIVSIRSPGQMWSHEFEDGDKAVMPTPPGMQGSPELNMMVDMTENGDKVHFKLVVLVTNYDFTLLEGELRASKCDGEGGSKQTKHCPAVEFIPDEPGAGKCSFSQQCSKLECVAEGDGHKLIADFKVSRCGKSLVASVKLQQPEEDLDWSERLKNGEKAKLPIKASSFTGGLAVSDAKLFVQVHLKEMQDNRVNFTVRMTGHLTALGETVQVNTVLIQGQIAVSSVADCGSWFSEQSTAVKVLVILVPITAGILLTLTVVFCCCKRRRDGTRLYVNIFKSRNDGYGMRRLSNEL